MQGHAFAGEFQEAPQPFIHGARGRMDERPDLVRSVTDGRYVYLRNYFPHVSQAQHVSYQFETPSTRIWRALYDKGMTNEAQSIFWKVPKAPEELYDLTTDPDTVRNLASSPQHQDVLKKMRQAQRDHAKRIRDVSFLPEGEIHSRSQGTTPYDMARDEAKYPFERIFETAELASSLDSAALPQLAERMKDADSAVRYWAAMGYLMRGEAGVKEGRAALTAALKDSSPYVRIVVAEALGRFGDEGELKAALAVLGELAPADKNGVLVSIPTLCAVNALGPKAAPLFDMIRTMAQQGPSPDERFNSYVPRLVADITGAPAGSAGEKAATPKAKGKGKKKAK
jgi:hypothetical protein